MLFLKETRKLGCEGLEEERNVVNVYPHLEKQALIGFGGSFTEAAAYNYSLLNEENRRLFMESCFDRQKGAGYTVGRVHIGSCDFSISPYSEAYLPDLSDFSIEQDRKYIIPMIKDALQYTDDELFLFASPWSPPAFMKDTGSLFGGGKLKKEFYPVYAEYFARFITAYAAEGIRISAVTVQNEAHAVQTWESCLYTAQEEAEFATLHLRPTLDRYGLKDVKIIIWDHNRERIVERAEESFSFEGAEEAIWGMGFHWYSGAHFDGLDLFRNLYPQKEIFETELCHESSDSFNDDFRTFDYAYEYINCLRHGASAVCDWNLMLDSETGGPFHNRTTGGCAAPTYCDAKSGTMLTDGIFEPIRLISSSLSRKDRVVATTSPSADLLEVALKKENGEIVLLILNTADEEKTVNVRMNGKVASFTLPANSLSSNTIVS